MSEPNETARGAAATAQNATQQATEAMTGLARNAAEAQKTMLAEMTRLFGEMRIPSIDTNALIAAHRRNMEVLSAANRVALEGAQAVARRHMEIVQQAMAELSEHVRELSSADAPQARAARQAELIKRSYEHAVSNLREVSDLIQRSNQEAVDLLNRRFTEAMDELRNIVGKAG